ncbi:MAG: XdhC family protein [Thermoprotei archaeon]
MSGTEFDAKMREMLSGGQAFCVATVVKTVGSTLAKQGFKILVDSQGNILAGTLGGACPEGTVAELASQCISRRSPRLVKVFLEDAGRAVAAATVEKDDEIHVETNCGGNMEIFLDPYVGPERLFVFTDGGKDDVASAFIKMAKLVGFEVNLVDPTETVEGADKRTPRPELSGLDIGEHDYAIVLTRGKTDIEVLTEVSKHKFGFVGLLASKTRFGADIEQLRSRGVSQEFLASIRSPLGVDIGAQTPAEIAVSILAEVVAKKRNKSVQRKT